MPMTLAGSTTLRLAIALALAGAAAAGAAAQEVRLEEIVVTAQKREQALADIPMSVTALPTEEIALSGADSIEDLQFKVPGFSLVNFYAGGQQYQLRGISSNQGLPTVGIYVDEMPINSDAANNNLEIDLRDLERVEVLRGPQGTLYGEGSMGGTIKYVTAAPKLDVVEGRIGTGLDAVADGSENWNLNGMVNLPLVEDALALRVAASYDEIGGWIDNLTVDRDDVNEGSKLNVRAKLLWQPSEATAASLLYLHGDVDVEAASFSVEDRQSLSPLPSPIQDQYDLFNLVLSHDYGGFGLLSSTGYIDRTSDLQVDLSSFFIPLLEAPPPFGFGFPPGTFSAVGAATTTDIEIFTQELRLASSGDGKFRWTLGAYYRDYEARGLTSSFEEPVTVAELIGNPAFALIGGTSVSESRAWAVFGEGSYALTPSLEVTLGARYYEDDREVMNDLIQFGFASSESNSGKFDTFNPRFALLYRLGEASSLYFNAAKGFRSGGFNSQASGGGLPVPPTYDPEELWSYEVGGTHSQLAGRLLLQWSVYYNDWKDVQTFGFLPGSPFTVLVNGGEASGFGVDLQATWLPTESLELAAAAGWNEMEYDSTTADHQPGDPMDFVSPFTGALSATYRFDMGSDVRAYVRGEVQYTDNYEVNIRNFLANTVYSEARTLVRASVGLTKGPWEAQLFADNLLDEDKIAMPAYGSLVEPVRTLPRTIGLRLNYNY